MQLIPVRMINEYVYCPRLAYLEWVQGEFDESADTIEGRAKHATVDEPPRRGVKLDAPEDEQVEVIHNRSAYLSSQTHGLICKIDIVQGEGQEAIPVDYKKGAMPDIPEHAWEPDRVQVCAQALVLSDNGYTVPNGIVYYVESKRRVEIPITEELKQRTLQAARDLRSMAEKEEMPPPLPGSRKCEGCSLAGICLPDEVTLLKLTPDDGKAPEEQEVRRLLPARHDSLPLYVQEQGAVVGKSAETLTVTKGGNKLAEARLVHTSQVCVMGAVQLTSQAVNELLSRGIPLCHFSYGGWFYGMTRGHDHKNVELRIAQYRTAFDNSAAISLARCLVASKISNCRTLLRRNHQDPPVQALALLHNLAEQASAAQTAEALLGIEGNAAGIYFENFPGMLKPKEGRTEAGLAFDFKSRNRRPPRDPINALLSLAYTLLLKDCHVILAAVGFDPYLGFFHRPKYGKPALALDVMEEFRPILADSVVLSAVNSGVVSPSDFRITSSGVMLLPAGRKAFIGAYERRMDSLVTHPVFGYRVSYRRIIEVQVRLMSRYVQGELGPLSEFPGFMTR